MGFQADLEEGEELLYGEVYAPSEKLEPFALGVSTRAIYFAEKKKFALRDPWVLHRILFAKILSVSLVRAKPYGW